MKMSRRKSVAAAMLFVCLASTSGADAGEIDNGLRTFLATYRCAVVERLERMHARGDRSVQWDRYLILASRSVPEHYVQCIFTDNDTEMFCEAASGYYAPVRFHLAFSAMAALQRLGFSADGSKGNYQRYIGVKSPADFPGVADLILSTLHEVYDIRDGSDLEWKTPLTPEVKGNPSQCVPIG